MILGSTAVMLSLITLGVVYTAPQGDQSNTIIPILKQSQIGPNPDGTYFWSYETGNNIKAEEKASIVQSPSNNNNNYNNNNGGGGGASLTSVQGSYSYIGDDGVPIQVTYTADDKGFQPKGNHFPNPPEIPPAIIRALQWIADHPEEDNLRK